MTVGARIGTFVLGALALLFSIGALPASAQVGFYEKRCVDDPSRVGFGDPEQRIASCRSALIHENQTDERRHLILSLLQYYQTQVFTYEQAKETFDVILEARPDDVATRIYLAALHKREGYFDLALAEANVAVSADPDNAKAYSIRGDVLADMARFGEAIDDLKRSLEIDPRHRIAYALLGQTFDRFGELDAAATHFLRAYDLNYRPDWLVGRLGALGVEMAAWKDHFRAALPEGYELAHEAKQSTSWLFQFVPEGQSVQKWDQMITLRVSVFARAPRDVERQLTDTILSDFAAPCDSGEVRQARIGPEILQFENGSKVAKLFANLGQASGMAICDGVDRSQVPAHFQVLENGLIETRTFVERLKGEAAVTFTAMFEAQSDDVTGSELADSALMEEVALPFLASAIPRHAW